MTDMEGVLGKPEFVRGVEEVQHKIMGTIAHDLRTPLGVASNYTELLLIGNFTDEQKSKMLQTTARNISRVQSAIEEMLDVEKLRAGAGFVLRFEEFDLAALIGRICNESEMIYSREITSVIPDYEVIGTFDNSAITRTVENLISNAVKFGSLDEPITVSLEDLGERISLKVHNKGDPIPKDVTKDIFKSFYKGMKSPNSRAKGWGLGLSLVNIVATAHAGEVTLESDERNGTTFQVILYKNHRADGEEITELLH